MQNNNIAVVINSPTLGGAERSILIQSECMGKIDLIVPKGEVSDYCQNLKHINVINYYYPPVLFSISRTGNSLWLILGFFVLPLILLQFKKHKLQQYKMIWANGNKAGFVILIYCLIIGFAGKMVWHFRDYPIVKGKWKYIWKLLNLPKKFRLVLVGNSNSVSNSLHVLGSHIIKTVYNPVGELPTMKKTGDVKNIGIVSMMAPWKGIHQIIIWASLFENELLAIGIQNILLYGGQIYKTSGKHRGYQEQLQRLHEKFPSKLIKFAGRVDPAVIYRKIDLLIHPVIEAEPFGRVITEAYSCGIPVLSTKLGGSCELVIDGEFFVYDYAGLTEWVRLVAQKKEVYHDLVQRGQIRTDEIEANIQIDIQDLLNC